MKKKLLSVILAGFMVMGCLAGCTSNDQTVENEKNTSETEQAESGEKTVITVARWGTDSEKEAFENIFAEFEKAHPEIDVQLDFRPWDTYWDMINVNMSGGMLPDIVSVSTQLGSKYYIPGVFEDLAPYIERDEVKTEEFAQNIMDAFTMDGKVFGFPNDISLYPLCYNKALLDESGIAYPASDNPLTFDEYYEMAKKLTKIEGNAYTQVGFADEARTAFRLQWLFPMYGGSMFDQTVNPTKITIDTPEGRKGVEAIAKMADVVAPVAEWGKSWDGGLQNSAIATCTSGIWMFGDFKKAGVDFGVAPMPEGIEGSAVTGLINGFMMASNCENKEAAWQVLKWLSSRDGQLQVAKNGVGTPIYSELCTDPAFANQIEGVDLSAYSYMLDHFQPLAMMPDDSLNIFIENKIKDLLEGKIDVDGFIEAMTGEGQEILDAMYQ